MPHVSLLLPSQITCTDRHRWRRHEGMKPTDFLKELLNIDSISGTSLDENSRYWISKLLSFLHRHFPARDGTTCHPTESTSAEKQVFRTMEAQENKKLTWCLLNHSYSLLWLQQCLLDRVPSAPSPTSSVSGRSPGQQKTCWSMLGTATRWGTNSRNIKSVEYHGHFMRIGQTFTTIRVIHSLH